jgi:hypothetical protein
MRYGIIGVRDFNGKIYDNKEYVLSALKENVTGASLIISGGGKGIETIVEGWAGTENIKYKRILPNIQVHGKRDAFLVRNLEILSACDVFVIFWDGRVDSMTKPISSAVAEGKKAIILPLK